jgi:hypothetical protein
MHAHLPGFFSKLDFWAALLDIVGLSVLVSHDIDMLKFVYNLATLLPPMRRWHNLDLAVQTVVRQFADQYPGAEQETLLASFQGKEATDLTSLFPVRSPDVPEEVDLYAMFVGPTFPSEEIMLWLTRGGETRGQLVRPMTDTELADRLEKKKQNFIYSLGFALMALASVLYLTGVIVNHP